MQPPTRHKEALLEIKSKNADKFRRPSGVIARINKGSYVPHMDYLITEHYFSDMAHKEKRTKSIKSGFEIFRDMLGYNSYILRNLKSFKKADIIVSTGWSSILLKMLIKLKLLKCKRFFWLGFFIHTPKAFPFMRFILNMTAIRNETFIVHAKFDAELYQAKLNICPSKMKVLPYGDWKETWIDNPKVVNTDGYYFAGGYTDRDYKSLIQAFKQTDKKLIIVGSHLNKDLNVEVPQNIQIKKDIDKKSFHELVRKAKVCILPMKQATGSSGHMVLLNYMKEGKAILATNVPGLSDYVEDGTSALLMNDLVRELPEMIRRLEEDNKLIIQLQKGAIAYYNENFSKEALSKRFSEIIFS